MVTILGKSVYIIDMWPLREENKNAFPKCFQNFPNTIEIIDCAEGAIEKTSLAKAQTQIYSNYKSKNTWKVLICVTSYGSVSFVSKIYGGCASEQYIKRLAVLWRKLTLEIH